MFRTLVLVFPLSGLLCAQALTPYRLECESQAGPLAIEMRVWDGNGRESG